jgi:nicotinate-nucleotide adenylyltransferase
LNRRTGLLGGTFDPVHYGHLALAEAAGELCALDDILLLPAALPPHKQNRRINAFADRVKMLDIAVKRRKKISVSTIEQLLPIPSFTVDTLRYLKLHSPVDVQFFFISGADAFLDILSWKNCDLLLQECHFAVFSRRGKSNKKLIRFIETLGFENDTVNCWEHPVSGKQIYYANLELPNISSSMVRKRVRNAKSVKHLIPHGVADFIRENSLYAS